MKYKPLVVKETLAKDFIRSVHHVWGSAESCSTTRDLLCDKWLSQLLTTKHMPVLPLWEAPQSSSYAIGLFWRPNTSTEHTSITTSLSFLLDGPWRTCPAHRAPTSQEKERSCLMRNGPHPFLGPWSDPCQQPLSTSPCLWKDFMRTQAHDEMCLLPHDETSDSKVHQHSAGTYHRAVSPVCFQIS